MLCDSTTGYISCFKIYSGIGQPLKNTDELLAHFYGKWYHLYMDNYYNSVELAENLFRKKSGSVERYDKTEDSRLN